MKSVTTNRSAPMSWPRLQRLTDPGEVLLVVVDVLGVVDRQPAVVLEEADGLLVDVERPVRDAERVVRGGRERRGRHRWTRRRRRSSPPQAASSVGPMAQAAQGDGAGGRGSAVGSWAMRRRTDAGWRLISAGGGREQSGSRWSGVVRPLRRRRASWERVGRAGQRRGGVGRPSVAHTWSPGRSIGSRWSGPTWATTSEPSGASPARRTTGPWKTRLGDREPRPPRRRRRRPRRETRIRSGRTIRVPGPPSWPRAARAGRVAPSASTVVAVPLPASAARPASRLAWPMKPATKTVAGQVVDLGGRADLLDPALVHDRDPVAHRERLLLIVGDEDEGDADLALDALELELHAPGAASGRGRRAARRAGGRSGS